MRTISREDLFEDAGRCCPGSMTTVASPPVRPDPNALRRVTADEIEGVLERELRWRLSRPDDAGLRDMIGCVTRIDLGAQAVRISVSRARLSRDAVIEAESDPLDPNVVIVTLPIRCSFAVAALGSLGRMTVPRACSATWC